MLGPQPTEQDQGLNPCPHGCSSASLPLSHDGNSQFFFFLFHLKLCVRVSIGHWCSFSNNSSGNNILLAFFFNELSNIIYSLSNALVFQTLQLPLTIPSWLCVAISSLRLVSATIWISMSSFEEDKTKSIKVCSGITFLHREFISYIYILNIYILIYNI